MKLVSFLHGGAAHYGAVKGERVVDLGARLGGRYPDLVSFIAGNGLPVARSILAAEPGDFDYASITLLPVVPRPGKILCVGVNYADHLEEANRHRGQNRPASAFPMIFARWPESLAAHRAPILRPRVSTQLDWEAELLVVIGKATGRYLPQDRALEHVFGYACMNEACLRDYQFHNSQINPGKNFENTGATGPWLVTADEIPDPQVLDIEMRLNGQQMQHGNTRDMVHSVAKVIAYISQWMPLQPGDVIASGTMGGVGFTRQPPIFMQPGDIAEVTIQGIGTLRNEIRDEPVNP